MVYLIQIKRMFPKNALYFIFLPILMISACKKAPNYPKEPSITLKEFRVVSYQSNKTDTVFIALNFKDGDGDLGNDPLIPNNKDFFVQIQRKENGIFNPVNLGALNFDAALPLLSPYRAVGPIDGIINRKIGLEFPPALDTLAQYDTLKFEFRIKDRASNYSNWIETDTMVLWRNF